MDNSIFLLIYIFIDIKNKKTSIYNDLIIINGNLYLFIIYIIDCKINIFLFLLFLVV